ncbi:DUF2799 domain-containing protein, partial [Escherichia coli]|uniref:DUF2799 domain-containing protein n=2 Tax=Escherichia coli TaxID=562 RepID=UPI001FCCCF8C
MMKKFIAPLLALLVSGCQIDPYTHAPTLTSTDWYDVDMEDAISGSAIKDDDAFSDSQADRGLYLKGYAEGQKKTCQTDFTGNDSNLLIVFYVQIMPDDFVMQLHR